MRLAMLKRLLAYFRPKQDEESPIEVLGISFARDRSREANGVMCWTGRHGDEEIFLDEVIENVWEASRSGDCGFLGKSAESALTRYFRWQGYHV